MLHSSVKIEYSKNMSKDPKKIITLNTWNLGVFWIKDLSLIWSTMTKIRSIKTHLKILEKMVFKIKV